MTGAKATGNVLSSLSTDIGRQLANARQEKQLTIDQVMAELKLDARTIQAIESGLYDGIPSVYLRGYLRNYARCLNMNEAKILQAAAPFLTDRTITKPFVDYYGQNDSMDMRNLCMRLATGVIVGTFLVLFFLYWWQERRAVAVVTAIEPPPAAPATETPPVTDLITVSGKSDIIPPSPVNTDDDPVIDLVTVSGESDVIPPSPVNIDDDPVIDLVTVSGESDIISPSPVDTDDDRSWSTHEADTRPERADTLAATHDPHPSSDEPPAMEIQLDDKCWVEVVDGRGKRLLTKMGQPGEHIVLTGEPPLSVLLGNADVAHIHYAGEPYDITPHSRGNVARFHLGD